MRVFITVLVLIFSLQSWTKADDSSDFEIEGMSIGDSLLDHMSLNEIKKEEKNHTKVGKKFIMIFYYQGSTTKLYNDVQVSYNPNDNDYIIHQISGFLDYKNNIQDCLKKKNEIKKEISEVFNNLDTKDKKNLPHPHDKSGETKYWATDFYLDSGAMINVGCMDWSSKFEEEKNWQDSLDVTISSSDYMKYLGVLYNHAKDS
jgi:hypothetical protein